MSEATGQSIADYPIVAGSNPKRIEEMLRPYILEVKLPRRVRLSGVKAPVVISDIQRIDTLLREAVPRPGLIKLKIVEIGANPTDGAIIITAKSNVVDNIPGHCRRDVPSIIGCTAGVRIQAFLTSNTAY
jgi:hypothetical protein